MRLKNYTDYSDDQIREIIRFCRPPGIGNFDVRVSNYAYGICRGRAYPEGSGLHDSAHPFVVVSITPDESKFPYFDTYAQNGYLPHLMLTRVEGLVYTISHELRHLWQKRHGRGRRVWGSRRGGFSERDCDAYAIRKIREWRRKHLVVDVAARFDVLERGKPQQQQPDDHAVVVKKSTKNPEIIDVQIALLTARKKKWEMKLKRAHTAIKKIERKIKRLEKKKVKRNEGPVRSHSGKLKSATKLRV
jgi:hypothetical protein